MTSMSAVMGRRCLQVLGAAAIVSCVSRPAFPPPAIPARVATSFPAAWQLPAGAKPHAFARNAMVVSNEPLASEAGREVLRLGGNAVDAAVAVGFALAVTYPEAGNLGGGGYMIIRMADGRTAALDYRETAPRAASRDMYVDSSGEATDKSVIGHLASGVPGAVAGLAAAQGRYGALPLSRVIEPAIRLARDGFIVDSVLHHSLARDSQAIEQFAGGALFFPDGQPVAVGSRLRQPALARTLQAIAERGASGFYRGEVAESIAAEMQRGGGIMTVEDLAGYESVWREPLRSTYRGYTLFGMPPSSSGGVTVAETFNILEGFGALPGFGTASYAHLLASAFQRAFIDRNSSLGDPAFVDVPIARLTSKAYADSLRRTIDRSRATPTLPPSSKGTTESTETTHYSVVDAAGNAVATTTTINGLYGSGVFIPGAGFFMNNEMDDFTSRPGIPNMYGLVQGANNAIAPGKRMLSAMTPTIVLDPAGELLMIVGGRGGPRIITSTAQVILNVIEHRMTLADAMRAPRIHHQALPDSLRFESNGLTQPVQDSLTAMGHHPTSKGAASGAVKAIMRVRGGYEGSWEPRSHGGAAGY